MLVDGCWRTKKSGSVRNEVLKHVRHSLDSYLGGRNRRRVRLVMARWAPEKVRCLRAADPGRIAEVYLADLGRTQRPYGCGIYFDRDPGRVYRRGGSDFI